MKKNLFLLSAGLALMAAAAEEPNFVIPRVETASTGWKLDGKLDDKVWKKAADISDFKPAKLRQKLVFEGPIRNRTSVRIFYDVDALYLGATCFESKPDKLVLGLPRGQSVDVPIGSNDDCLEIFLYHPGSEKTFYHLRIVPSGAKEDARVTIGGGRDTSWNGKWSVKTSIDRNAWYAEVRIPFRMFAEAEPGFLGRTPSSADHLKINLGRVSSTTGELTTWQVGENGFRSKFMDCGFSGMSFKEISLESSKVQHLKNGRNQYQFALCNLAARSAKARLKVTLREEETDPEKRRLQLLKRSYARPVRETVLLEKEYLLKPGEKLPLAVDFELAGGKEKTLLFNVDWLRMKHNISRGIVTENLYDIETGSGQCQERLSLLKSQLDKVVREKIPVGGKMESLLAEAEGLLKTGRDPAADPELRADSLKKMEKKLDEIEFQLSTEIRPRFWNAVNGKSNASFAVGTALPGEKVFRDLPFKGDFSNTVSMSLAQNEYESAQFVIFYLTGKRSEVKVSCSDLKQKNGAVIKAHQIFFNPVGYVNVGDSGHHTHVGYWPDVLYEGNAVEPPVKGSLRPVMLTLKTAKDQVPGDYTGKVCFESGTEKHEITLQVKVYPFALPDKKSLGMNIWFHGTRMRMFYGDFSFKRFDQAVSLMGRYCFASAIRVNMLGMLLRVRGDNQKYHFDFSLAEPYFDSAFRNHANMLNLDYFEPDFFKKPRRILIGKDGELEMFTPADPAAAADQLFVETVDFFKKKGYYKYAVIQVSDEPWNQKKQAYIRKKVPHLRSLVKDLPPVICAGAVRNRTNLNGYVDYWCPQFPQFNPADYKGMPAHERLCFYQCLYKQDFPMYMIDRPGIEPRIAALICWKFQARAFLYWAPEQWVAGGANTPVNRKKLQNRWIHEEWGFPFRSFPGDGCLIYPAKDGVIASLRAQYIRDGVEDYEYLAVLKHYRDLALKKGKLNDSMAAETAAMLKLPDHIVRTTNSWTKSEKELTRFRNQVAETIVRLQQLVKE